MNSKLIKKHDEARLTDTNTNGKLLLHSEISKEVAVKFGRYLLKEASHHWDKDATLCWKVANEEFDTLFLFDKFMEESF